MTFSHCIPTGVNLQCARDGIMLPSLIWERQNSPYLSPFLRLISSQRAYMYRRSRHTVGKLAEKHTWHDHGGHQAIFSSRSFFAPSVLSYRLNHTYFNDVTCSPSPSAHLRHDVHPNRIPYHSLSTLPRRWTSVCEWSENERKEKTEKNHLSATTLESFRWLTKISPTGPHLPLRVLTFGMVAVQTISLSYPNHNQ